MPSATAARPALYSRADCPTAAHIFSSKSSSSQSPRPVLPRNPRPSPEPAPRGDFAEQPIHWRGEAAVAERAGPLLRWHPALSVQAAILQRPVGCPPVVFSQHRTVHLLLLSHRRVRSG